VPIKPFASSKRRLGEVMSPASRSLLSEQLGSHTLEALRAAGIDPLVLAADDEVAAWGNSLGLQTITDDGASLNQAANTALAAAALRGQPWLICHADLPLLTPQALVAAVSTLAGGGCVIAPSYDGGTNLLGGSFTTFTFSYGPGSFHRHLRQLAPHHPLIAVTPLVALDLDQPADLQAAAARVPWLADLVNSLPLP
jgi:2-phospho-L-lactate guanylyltransferase